ncbi:hypothetical protein GYN67_08090 [Lactococcus piscium]|uniref:hypothetical protein n=1 Tax=Pseudolactococcus carnosus TaxID=2749961 RepID=UPI001FB86C5D|nr:hypothetical protein [Lactococcus carnosus]MCJ1996649.1 hypothetical protein [Lactococcus carnosus]
MTYSELPENGYIRKKVCNEINWIKDLSEIKIEKGIYFFRENEEIVYIGQGGGIGQNLKTRLNQYFKPSDSGTIAFKLKVRYYPEGLRKDDKRKYFKDNYQQTWRKYMTNTFEIGILSICEESDHDIKLEEAYLIGLFKTKYNY